MPPRTRTPRDIPRWADALRMRRSALGLSQDEVAQRSQDGLAQRTVSALENGTIDLRDLSVGRLLALARALGWTLYDLQQATRLDLGIETPEGRLSPAPVRTFPLYPLEEASKPLSQMKPFPEYPAPVWARDACPGLCVFFEGHHPVTGGKLHYIDTTDHHPEPDHAYLIVYQDIPQICDYQETSSRNGSIGIFVSRSGRFIPPEDSQVVGRRYLLSSIERA
ncbi:helix-turn-helix transcriptional regulator [Deinococcus cellulosilyticus]|uniref:HTH cro/C1-type domain-containing protein n=1 Tax=Deinococcus cellulosilyticus (strain DSM 18568 / NBRC 106333 / KACC 11606 / 5516J-15) TaxID=1223518 RepID=A0A511N285_DEIC1|nr:helix-turn-helix transcriptional regulator [Deinococcus cellulosilyticus]GEM46617.1 hypothetical protein DC3_22520 [Deinococcus cellulosilyticus NBRC 106333 = KACC 11606]